ncbi:MAG: hypothetical protein WAX29_03945 [Propionibacterium sp.]
MRSTLIAAVLIIGLALTVIVGGILVIPAVVVTAITSNASLSQGTTQNIGSVPGIPDTLVKAYVNAAAKAPKGCKGMRWQILAGIGQIETNQVAGSTIDANGTISPPIYGPPIGFADTDGGKYDGTASADRAAGPMQFIPTSWVAYNSAPFTGDGNGDGRIDPQNVYDATLAAANHLCGWPGTDLSDTTKLSAAIYGYNRSHEYVQRVLDAIGNFDRMGVTAAGAGGPAQTFNGTCAADVGLPQPNPNNCVAAIKKAYAMTQGECIWFRMCLAAVAVEYGKGSSGSYSAQTHWNLLVSQGLAHAGDRNPPPGALVFWQGGNWGHVALYVGGGKIVTNDLIRHGCIDVADFNAIESQWGFRYLGWTNPYFPNGA